MDTITNQVYQHLRDRASFNKLEGVIVLPTQAQSSKILTNLHPDEIDFAYQELLQNGIIENYSEYQYVPALQFQLTNRLEKLMGLR